MHLVLPLLCLLGSTVNAFYVGGRGVGNEILDCSHGSAFLPSPYDCHSFYRCFAPNAVPVKMSCGFLMYNPILNHCDWPSNTIRVREECGTSNGYFGNNSEAGAETREVEATTAKPKEVATTPKEPRIIAEPDFVAGAPVVFYVNKKTENKPPRLSQGRTKKDADRVPSLFEIILDPEGELQEEEKEPTLFDIVLRPEKFISQSAEEREAEEEDDEPEKRLPNPSDFNQFRYEFTTSSTTTTTQPSTTTTTKPTTTSTTTTEQFPNFPLNDVEVFDRDNFTITTTTTTTSTSTPELLNQADRQMFLRKLELGLITTTTTQSTTTTPSTTTTAKLTTKSNTTKRPNYKYSRPTYFFSAPTFGPPCYCPCLTSASYGSQKYDPFEEQKLLFDLERARGYSTEDPLTTTQGMTEEEMTTITPDTFRYIQEEGDSILLEDQTEFTTTMTTPHGRSLNYTNLESLAAAESQEEVSTYYPIQNEDEEPITDLPLEPIKPRFFQAFEFVEIARKLGEQEPEEEGTENTNEVEPSESITQCIGEFLGCLEKSGDKLSTRAKKCYQLFQDCSGSVILIPDV